MKAKKPSKATQARLARELEQKRIEWQRMLAERIYRSTGRKVGVLAEG